MRAGTGAIRQYFFQLTPMCGALFYRWGGLDLLSRMNQVLAFMALPLVWGLAGLLGISGWRRGWMVVVWCLSPLWWYQQAVPTTEILQLLLLCGALVFYLDAERKGVRFPLGAAFLLAAIGINHFGFPPLVAILLVVAAAAESVACRPGRMGRLLTCAAALAVGLAWDLVFSSVTIQTPQVSHRVVSQVLVPFVVCVAAAAVISRCGIGERHAARVGRLARLCGMVAGILVIVVTAILAHPAARSLVPGLAGRISLLADCLLRFSRFLSFHGVALLLLFGVGAFLLSMDATQSTRRVRVLAAGLAGVVLLLFVNPGIASLYPWAFRRHIVFLLPLAALVLGHGVTVPVVVHWSRFARAGLVATLLLSGGVLAAGTLACLPAARVGDYVGYRQALATVNASIRAGDVVVADDPRAGTPLLLMHGRDVLDGRPLWKHRDPESLRQYLAMLRRLQIEKGRRILWLTSTGDGLGVYPADIGPVEPLNDPVEVTLRMVIHSPNADGFATREEQRRLQLFVWPAQGGQM